MEKQIILIGIFIMLAGCQGEEQIKTATIEQTDLGFNITWSNETTSECQTDDQCRELHWDSSIYSAWACVENKCQKVDCVKNFQCGIGIWNQEYCVDYVCVNFIPICEKIAKKDYKLKESKCSYFDICDCTEIITLSEERRIQHNNSIEIIPKQTKEGRQIQFELTTK